VLSAELLYDYIPTATILASSLAGVPTIREKAAFVCVVGLRFISHEDPDATTETHYHSDYVDDNNIGGVFVHH
jgi:hypothetical protein